MDTTLDSKPLRKSSVWAWFLYDWASQPFFTLVTTFVFAPYFAARIASDSVVGQELWGYAAAIAGLIIAILSPSLGAAADVSGRRKPWIAFFSILIVLGSSLLWIGAPGQEHLIPMILFAFVIATIGAEFAIVFTNAMMPDLVSSNYLGRLSGYGWAIGYVGGLISLIIVLGFMAANPESGRTVFGIEPIFGLDPQLGEGDRASGPFSAIWYIIFALPLFLFVKENPQKSSYMAVLISGLTSWKNIVKDFQKNTNIFKYLLANMAFKDGLVALFAFGGIYAAGVLGWQTIQIGIFGIIILVGSTFGSIIGGWLNDRLNSKIILHSSLLVLIACCIGIVSTDSSHIFFFIQVSPVTSTTPLFSTAPEILYLILGVMIGAVSGPIQAASRTLLIKLAPKEEITHYFGLFAMSGKLTSFLAPLSVAVVTGISQSQRVGISVIIAFFVLGYLLLHLVLEED